MFGLKANFVLPNPRAVRRRLALLGPTLFHRRPTPCPPIPRPHLLIHFLLFHPLPAPPTRGVCGTFWGRLGLFSDRRAYRTTAPLHRVDHSGAQRLPDRTAPSGESLNPLAMENPRSRLSPHPQPRPHPAFRRRHRSLSSPSRSRHFHPRQIPRRPRRSALFSRRSGHPEHGRLFQTPSPQLFPLEPAGSP